MQVQINGSEIEIPSGVGLRVGELVETLAVHIQPGDVLMRVQLDGESFAAGDRALASRSVEECSILCLTTVPGTLAGNTLSDAEPALLAVVASEVARALVALEQGDAGTAENLLGRLYADLQGALALDD